MTTFSLTPTRRQSLALALLLASALATARADEAGQQADAEAATPALRLSGFGTLGFTHNDNHDAGAIFSSAQKRPAGQGWSANLDSVLGLQVEWQAGPDTAFVLQGVARAGDDLSPELRMAYLRQQISNDFAVRGGRIRSPLYFDSDVVEIGYAYLMARPALPLYGTVNSVASLDGADLQWRHNFGDTAVLAQAYYGQSDYHHRFYNLDPVQAADASLRHIRGLAVSATFPNLILRASHSLIGSYTMRSPQVSQINAATAQIAGALQAAAANPFLPAALGAGLQAKAQGIRALAAPFDSRPLYTSVGFDANAGDWRLLGEATRLDSRSAMVGKYHGYQFTLARSFDEITPYVSLARQRRASPALDTSALTPSGLDPALDGALAQLKGGLDQAARYADLSTRSISAGVRYDFRGNMALKLQYDHMKTPGAYAPGYFAVSHLPIRPTVNLFTVSLDFVF